MNGYLYLITNSCNNKSYVGKTYDSLVVRWKDHIKKSVIHPTRPLYAAMLKYGISNFTIEELGIFPEDILEIKEQEYIALYNTFKHGYNATLGGDGKRYIDISDEEIIRTYLKLKSTFKVSIKLNIDIKTIIKVLESNSIKRDLKDCNAVRILEYDIEFDSVRNCAQFLLENDFTTVNDLNYLRRAIARVCQGLRKSYLGLQFEYI